MPGLPRQRQARLDGIPVDKLALHVNGTAETHHIELAAASAALPPWLVALRSWLPPQASAQAASGGMARSRL